MIYRDLIRELPSAYAKDSRCKRLGHIKTRPVFGRCRAKIERRSAFLEILFREHFNLFRKQLERVLRRIALSHQVKLEAVCEPLPGQIRRRENYGCQSVFKFRCHSPKYRPSRILRQAHIADSAIPPPEPFRKPFLEPFAKRLPKRLSERFRKPAKAHVIQETRNA